MAQTPIRDEDARALAQKIASFATSLDDRERNAFEALERTISVLVPAGDIDDELERGDIENRREALWYRLMTRLDVA